MTVSQKWDKRVGQWHDHVTSAAAFGKVLDGIVALSQPRPSDVCVDLGAGTGFVTTALAPLVASVHAVDISPAMTEALAERAADAGLANVSTEVADLKDFRFPPSRAGLIVSSYALHHLADADKRALTARAAQWLRPGGRLVIADMMFGRGGSRRDRAILRQKAASLAAKGIGGWWRIAKNLTRYGLRVGPERPATPEFWQQALRDAGLAEVRFHPVAAEAGIVCGVRPPSLLWPEAGGRRRGARRAGGRSQDGDKVPGPSGKVLAGRTVLAGYLGGECAAGCARGVQLDPFRVDVELHRDPRAVAGQRGGQVSGQGGHARRVHQIARGVLADRAAGHVRAVAEGRAPQRRVARRRGRLSIQHQRLQVLPDAVDGLARRGQPTVPDPDPGVPGPVNHQAGEAWQQRADHMSFLHVAARACRQLEPAVERGQKPAAFGTSHGRPGAHQPGCGRARVCAAVVQDVPDGAEEDRDGHQGTVRGPNADDAHPRPGHRCQGRDAPGR